MNKRTSHPTELTPPSPPAASARLGRGVPDRSEGRLSPRLSSGSLQTLLLETKGAGGQGRAFVPTGTGTQHPATSAHTTAPPRTGACGQSRGGDRTGSGRGPSLAPRGTSPWPQTEQKMTTGNRSKPCRDPAAMPRGEPGSLRSQGRIPTREEVSQSCQRPAPRLSNRARHRAVPARCSCPQHPP